MNRLTELGIKYFTDKAYFHRFTEFYQDIFEPRKYHQLNILELGILQGGSLLMLHDYFPQAQIYGIDINESSVRQYGDRIITYQCSQVDECRLNKLFQDIQFDIIIDDGSHLTMHQILSLGILFPKLKDGGIYIIEDIHTSLRPKYCNSLTNPLNLFDNFNQNNRQLNIPEIDPIANNYLNLHIKDIVVWHRTQNALICYNCRTQNNGDHTKCIHCGTDLSPLDPSITALITKKA